MHPCDRIRQIQTGNPGPIDIIDFIESDSFIDIEKELHEKLSMYNVFGEWFENRDEVREAFHKCKSNAIN